MKNIHYILLFFCSTFAFAQNIFLTEVKATHNNTDKFLYQISNEPTSENQYLGKIEISGYSEKDEEVFAEVYKKAKSVGGNTFIIKSPEQVDGTQVFNPAHYYIYVYYTEADKIAKEQNLIYIINPNKEVQLRINNTKQKLLPRTYIKYDISKTEITDISVGTILGSRIKFQPKEGQPEQYFQLSGKKVKANPEDNPGINFKTGDIIKLEKSYAQFLINIYQRVEVK
mgnify:FL=1